MKETILLFNITDRNTKLKLERILLPLKLRIRRIPVSQYGQTLAALCGLEDELNSAGVLNTLAQFPDYVKAAEWARPALAFCYHIGILDQNDLEIRPLDAVNRAEVAQMLFCMLDKARLL